MKIALVGGTGYIGLKLSNRLVELGHKVIVVSRNPREHAKSNFEMRGLDELPLIVESVDAVVNLAGTSISGPRWTKKRKIEIVNSRVLSTRAIVNAVNGSVKKPKLISLSGSGIYGNTQTPCGEYSGVGSSFLAQVCSAWEAEAHKVNSDLVVARLGVVLDSEEGALPKLAMSLRIFAGVRLGNGNQRLPWIHVEDAVEKLCALILDSTRTGVYNVVAPGIVSHKQFMQILANVMKRPLLVKIPELFVRMVLGDQAEVVVFGQNVVACRILDVGSEFKYPSLKPALTELMRR